MKLIFVGNNFYFESGTRMSSIYTEDGKRCDWGIVQLALQKGEEVNIRQATRIERQHYKDLLYPVRIKG